MITTRLVQWTLTGSKAKTMCHCGKICKNLQGLKIHQAKTRCGSGKRQKELTVMTDKTEENHSQDEHHSVEDLLPPEATQISTEKSKVIQTSEEHQLSLQVTAGNNEYSGKHTNGRRTSVAFITVNYCIHSRTRTVWIS